MDRIKLLKHWLELVEYYLKSEQQPEIQVQGSFAILFDLNRDDATGRADFEVNTAPHKLRLLLRNVAELVRAPLRQRPLNIRRRTIHRSGARANFFVNFWSGTVVIVDRSRVLKFFFKQAAFYESLYAPLVDILECSLSSCQGVPVLLQPRYAQAAIGNHQVALRSLPRIPEEVSQMLDKLPHLRQQLSLRQGLRRMFECYRGTVAPDGIAPYLDIIAEIETMLGHFETKLCHGDVTAANIVIGRDGVPRLIDFDKLMVAPRSYDQVYFTSSALERQGALWALHLVKAMKRISDSVRTMKAELSQPIGWLNEAEISLCTLIIGLFKRIERDLNYDSVGHSGSELREGVRFVLAQIR